ncbi:MAG: rubredoxin [Fusobacteriaceae bacterium]
MRYLCTICSYVYDPKIGDVETGIKPGTEFQSIPEDWICPICSANKDNFEAINE